MKGIYKTILLLTLSILASCGGSSDNNTSSPNPTTPPSTTSTPTLAIPKYVVATAGTESVTITWDAELFHKYKIYWRKASGAEVPNITKSDQSITYYVMSTSGKKYTHTGLTPGSTYYYRIAYVDAVTGLSSELSEQVSATLQMPPPSVPTGIRVNTSKSGNTIVWEPVSGASGYNVYWSTDGGVTQSSNKINAGSLNQFTHISGIKGMSITYGVSAYNTGAESDLSSSITVYQPSNWTIHYPSEINLVLDDMLWTGTEYIAVGEYGMIVTSSDGVAWQKQYSGTNKYLFGVAWSGVEYVVVGEQSTVLTSVDGINWTIREVPIMGFQYALQVREGTPNGSEGNIPNQNIYLTISEKDIDLFDVVWDGSHFLAVGNYGRLMTSSDGISWYDYITQSDSGLIAIDTDGTTIKAVGFNGGIVTCDYLTAPSINNTYSGYSDSLNGYSVAQYSCALEQSGITQTLYDVKTINGNWITAGAAGALLVENAGSWLQQTTGSSNSFYSIGQLTTTGGYIVTGSNGTVITSDAGVSWTIRNSGATVALNDTVLNNGQLMAVGNSGVVISSNDAGVNWQYNTTMPDYINNIAWNGTSFVGVTDQGIYLTSNDGKQWTQVTTGSNVPMYQVLWANNQWISGGALGWTAVSSDGVNWTYNSADLYKSINDIIWDGSQYIAVGVSGLITSSPDGVTWTAQTSGVTDSLYGIVRDTNIWVAVGANGTIITSIDNGASWNIETSPVTGTISAVATNGQKFVAITRTGEIVTSTDGQSWSISKSGLGQLNDIAWTGSDWIIVGKDGLILRSSDGTQWDDKSTMLSTNLWGVTVTNTEIYTSGYQVIASTPK